MEFIKTNWPIIAVLVIAITFFLISLRHKTNSILYALMLQAKRLAKDAILSSGQQQEEWVVRAAMQVLPLPARLLLTEDKIRYAVKWLYREAKDYMDDGILNNSIK